jgi:hypothetical protein
VTHFEYFRGEWRNTRSDDQKEQYDLFGLNACRTGRWMARFPRIAHTIRPYKICVQTTHSVAYKIPHKVAHKIGSPAQGGFPISSWKYQNKAKGPKAERGNIVEESFNGLYVLGPLRFHEYYWHCSMNFCHLASLTWSEQLGGASILGKSAVIKLRFGDILEHAEGYSTLFF